METKTSPELLKRELTKTEIEIVSAQILDRLARIAIVTNEKRIIKEGGCSENTMRHLREAHDIPEGVHIFDEELRRFPWYPNRWNETKASVKKWVAGTLTFEEAIAIVADCEEFNEIDYAWAFMEKPSFYYTDEKPEGTDNVEAEHEFLKIGTRNNPKALK